MTGDKTVIQRREATRAFVRYFLLFFVLFVVLGGLVAAALYQAKQQRSDSRAIRIAYCMELEKLKTQNREDVATQKKNYKRNLRLLGIKDSPELRRASEESWNRALARNAPRPCPYTANP